MSDIFYTHKPKRPSITKYSIFNSIIKSACVLINSGVCIYADQSLNSIPDKYGKIRYTHDDVIFKRIVAEYKKHELKKYVKKIS